MVIIFHNLPVFFFCNVCPFSFEIYSYTKYAIHFFCIWQAINGQQRHPIGIAINIHCTQPDICAETMTIFVWPLVLLPSICCPLRAFVPQHFFIQDISAGKGAVLHQVVGDSLTLLFWTWTQDERWKKKTIIECIA